MSRFNRLVSNTNWFVHSLKADLSLDLGSSRTRIILDKELIWDEPTLIAWHQRLQSVVAIGEKAANLRGRTPEQVKLIQPVRHGVIADLDFAEYYLKSVFEQLKEQQKIKRWWWASVKVSLPSIASPLEKEQFSQVLNQVGIKVTQIVNPTQAVTALPTFHKITQSHGVINLGAQTVELGIFIGPELYQAHTLESVVGDNFTQTVTNKVLDEYNLQIGWQVAEDIKHRLIAGNMELDDKKSPLLTVRGKDAQTQLVKVARIKASIFRNEFYNLAQSLLADIKLIINQLPPAIITQLQEEGFYLTGGESQLLDWQTLIQDSWQIPVILSAQPTLDVVKGLSYVK